VAHDNDLASAQVHGRLEINSSRDEIILILIVGYGCYSTITDGSGQHSAVVLFDVYVAASERIVTWMRVRSNGRSQNALSLLHYKENDHVTVTITKNPSLVAITRYISIMTIYTVGYPQIFNAGHFFSSEHCHDL